MPDFFSELDSYESGSFFVPGNPPCASEATHYSAPLGVARLAVKIIAELQLAFRGAKRPPKGWPAVMVQASASKSFNAFPDSFFQALFPFSEPNTQNAAAADGLLNGISFVRTKSESI